VRRLVSIKMAVAVLLGGLAIVMAGIAYDVMYAGIPYQDDPGPKLAKEYAENSAFAGTICSAGGKVMAVGLAWLVVVLVSRLVVRLTQRLSR
jgi:uncharacterized membrane protein